MESPLDATNPFLEDEPGEDAVSEKEEELDKVRPNPYSAHHHSLQACGVDGITFSGVTSLQAPQKVAEPCIVRTLGGAVERSA